MLTRRAFLGASSVSLASIVAINLPASSAPAAHTAAMPPKPGWVRLFDRAPSFADASSTAPRAWLPPDQVLPAERWLLDRVCTPSGWLRVEDVQPVFPEAPAPVTSLPETVEVVSPLAPVHRWIGHDAPISARAGNGAVLHALAILDAPVPWLLVTDAAQRELGWLAAEHVRPANVSVAMQPATQIVYDTKAHVLAAFYDDTPLLIVADVSAARSVPGTYRCCEQHPMQMHRVPGAAWHLQFEHIALYGVHWHHTFGARTRASHPDTHIEMPVHLAKRLYALIHTDTTLIVTA